jgi:leukotriene-A4 hydrolase
MPTAIGLAGVFCLFIVALSVTDASSTASAGEDRTALQGKPPVSDTHSFGNPHEIQVTQVALDLTVDFDSRVLKGSAILDVKRQPGCPAGAPLKLDSRGLVIEEVGQRKLVFAPGPFTPTRFQLGSADPIKGSALSIDLDDSSTQVRIAYHTAPTAQALQWLAPGLTAGKAKPFLFTQSQAIHARSWIPLQDSPGVRVTYVARIAVPLGLTAVMAAESRIRPDESKQGVFDYVMPQPIPPYLIALAVGDLAFQSLGKRTGVWAEPGVLKAAAFEFADIEKMIAATEERFGSYRWGRHDILVLPPSFPFGGMENPKLTFATPTILAGDRSLVSLIAHELAHSWSGNLVTNATWRDFWLNEGVTTYVERRIIEELYGAERADMEAVLGLAELRDELKQVEPRDQILHIDLTGRDPDDGVTRIPYEKGALLMRTLERAFGRQRFDAFLHDYFEHFKFESITTADFEAFLRERLLGSGADADKTLNLRAWLEQPGLPADFALPKSTKLAAIDETARSYLAGATSAASLGAANWSTQEWLRFLRALPEILSLTRMDELDRAWSLTARGNAEIAHQWLLLAIKAGYKPADARLEDYLVTIGRRKLVVPLYRALLASPDGRKRAREIYDKARPGYHPITVATLERLFRE